MKPLDYLSIPEFSEFLQIPNNNLCKTIDSTRLMIEILGGLEQSGEEFSKSEYSSRLLLDGKYGLVIRYKREKDNNFYPAITLSFDSYEQDNICINQLQGSKGGHIGYRFFSSFNSVNYYVKLIEESFSQKGIYVYVKNIPEGLENASYASNAGKNYKNLTEGIKSLNDKYNLNKNNK